MSPTTKQGANTILIQFDSLKPVLVQLSQEASDYNDDKMSVMDEEEGWTMVTRGRWKKRQTFPLYLIAQESRKAQNQIQPRPRERSDKRQRRFGTKMYDNSAKPKNLESSSHWKNSSLENYFKITQPRLFTRSLVVKFKMKRRMLTMVAQMRLRHL